MSPYTFTYKWPLIVIVAPQKMHSE